MDLLVSSAISLVHSSKTSDLIIKWFNEGKITDFDGEEIPDT